MMSGNTIRKWITGILPILVSLYSCAAVTPRIKSGPKPTEITHLIQHLQDQGPSEKPKKLHSNDRFKAYFDSLKWDSGKVYGNFSAYRAKTWSDLSYRVMSELSADSKNLIVCDTTIKLHEPTKKYEGSSGWVTNCYEDVGADGSVENISVEREVGSYDEGKVRLDGVVHGSDHLKRCSNNFGTMKKCVKWTAVKSTKKVDQDYQKTVKLFFEMARKK